MEKSKYILPKIAKKKINSKLYKALGMQSTADLEGQALLIGFSCVFVPGTA